ncbi:MAG: hypothetical protein J6M59_10615 [Bacteroidaceae bacterium]|nr:hypothetical protein [Bacteroidaceae bacterium]
MKKYDNIIGIDPDSKKNGVAFVEVATKKLEVASLDFWQLYSYLTFVKEQSVKNGKTVLVVVEHSSYTAHNWHMRGGTNRAVSSRMGYDVGRCHRTGELIEEMCDNLGLECQKQVPLSKCWKGQDRKITHEEIVSITGLIAKRTNQEERDAVLLAWTTASLPIRLHPKGFFQDIH